MLIATISSCILNLYAAVGASIASFLLQPKQVVSLGASGAVFGLFVVSVLCKLSFNPRKLLECAILGQFVMQQVIHVSSASLDNALRATIICNIFTCLSGMPFSAWPKTAFLEVTLRLKYMQD